VIPRVVTAIAVLLAAGCGGSSGTQAPVGHATTPAPKRTVVSNARVYTVGETALIHAQAGVGLRLRAFPPRVSRSSLSSSYGYPPQHGYYLTFRLVVANTGNRPITLAPRDFYLRMPGQGRVSSYDGNSPYSGAGAQLDATELDIGQRLAAPLTFDVSKRHGRLAFAPDGSPAAVWTF
jgi:hypothetical protein